MEGLPQNLPLSMEARLTKPMPYHQIMIFRQLFDCDTCTYTYLIADPQSNDAAIVDPVIEQCDRDIKLLQELGLTLRYTFETHIHADHITGAHKLRQLTGCKVIVPDGAKVTGADGFIKDGEVVRVGNIGIQAINTPGHTDIDATYYINGDRILTGDTLFIRGCGRTDFQSGDPGQLYDSIISKLFTLPPETLIYPGHDYNGCTVSTVGEEMKCNPRLANTSRDDFIKLMDELNLPTPKRINEAVPANEKCGQC